MKYSQEARIRDVLTMLGEANSRQQIINKVWQRESQCCQYYKDVVCVHSDNKTETCTPKDCPIGKGIKYL